MHSTIFELQPCALDREKWATESNFIDNCNIDYCTRLDGESRDFRIKSLCNRDWFNMLFSEGQNDTIIYRGKDALTQFKKEWYQQLEQALSDIINRSSCDMWKLRYIVKRPFEVETMFCIPAWSGNNAFFMYELLTYLEEIEDNTTLHICAVFDYHY